MSNEGFQVPVTWNKKSDDETDQLEMQSKEADSKSAEDIAQTSSQGYDQQA